MHTQRNTHIYGGFYGEMVTVIRNKRISHSADTLEKVGIELLSCHLRVNSRADCAPQPWYGNPSTRI